MLHQLINEHFYKKVMYIIIISSMTGATIDAYLVGNSVSTAAAFRRLPFTCSHPSANAQVQKRRFVGLKNAGDDEVSSSNEIDEMNNETTATADSIDDVGEKDTDISANQDGESEEVEEEVDPEVVELKAEIEDLEASLSSKRRKLREAQDAAELYTKAGYARKVAEMENMRRVRSMMQSSNKSAASANVLQEFLPVIRKLGELEGKYENDDFGKQYGAIYGAFKSCYAKLGVTEYSVTAGEKVDVSRVLVIDSEYSDEVPKDNIIRSLKDGMELQGNVMEMAECVSSLGPEQPEEDTEIGRAHV